MNAVFPDDVILEDVDCPNGCSRDDIFILTGSDLLNGIPGEFNICRCRSCGLERTNPRPTPASIGVYYPAHYGPYKSQTVASEHSIMVLKDSLRRIFRLSDRILPDVRPGRMLEIGCSSGNYMEKARKLGWMVSGIEFSAEAAAVARRKGFSVQTGALERLIPYDSEYDMITGWMVLEHLHEPVIVLRKIREWIKPDGYLVLSVPSIDSISRKIFGCYSYDLQLPTHLFHFSPKTLSQVLVNSGWQIERIYWQRNCNTLLNSLEYWATAARRPVIFKFARWLRLSGFGAPIRFFISLLLGLSRQSGRIEVWARPAQSKNP